MATKSNCCNAKLRKVVFGPQSKLKIKWTCTRCGNVVITEDSGPEGWRYARENEVVTVVHRPVSNVRGVDVPKADVEQ